MPHPETREMVDGPSYKKLADTMRELREMVAKGEPRYALTSRAGGPFQFEQVAGRRPAPQIDIARVREAVAKRLSEAP